MREPGHAAGSTMLGLLGRPDQLVRVAVTEGLRSIAPIDWTECRAEHDTTINGIDLAEGDAVEVILASAKRDGSRFERPDEFDIDRPRQSPIPFGNGEHSSGHLCWDAA